MFQIFLSGPISTDISWASSARPKHPWQWSVPPFHKERVRWRIGTALYLLPHRLPGWEGVAADICRLAGCYLAYFLLCHMCSLAVNIAACYPFQYYSPAITFILPTARRYAAPSVSAAYSLVAYGLVYCKSAHQHVVPHVHSLMCQLSSFCKPTATTDYRLQTPPSPKFCKKGGLACQNAGANKESRNPETIFIIFSLLFLAMIKWCSCFKIDHELLSRVGASILGGRSLIDNDNLSFISIIIYREMGYT